MFGLCIPTGETTLVFKDGKVDSIALTDQSHPKSYILNDKYVLRAIKHYGYESIDKIRYERNGRRTEVSMAEYYYENADKLK